MKKLLLVISFFFPVCLHAQVAIDTLSTEALNQLLIEQIERLADEGEEENNYEDLIDSYIFFSENPINLNSEEIAHLAELQLINTFQLEALRNYRRHYGDFLFLNELEMVEGFDEQTINILRPIVCIRNDNTKDKITGHKMARYGKHQIIGRYEQILEKQQGYYPISDSELLDSPNSRYLGSPQKTELRYSYNYRNKIRAGFALEKDAGEMLFNGRLSDTIKNVLGSKRYSGFDFFGFHLYANDLGCIKDIAIGDYQLSFGQGLTLWSGMSFGKAAAGSSVMKQGRGVRPKASSSEAPFMRGTAVTLNFGKFYATAFYSNRMVDANVSLTDSLDEAQYVSSLQETGYHRTIGEILDRHAIRQQVIGGHLSFANEHLEIGYTLHHTLLSAALQPTPTHYNQFYFQGDHLTNQGLDFKYVSGKIAIFGEGSMSSNKAFASLVGLTVQPTGYLNFTALYRNFDKRYQNLLSSPFSESSRGQGEKGAYLGIEVAPAPYWNILLYADHFRFTWLTMQTYSPSWGHDYYCRISHSINKKSAFYLQFRSKTKMKNSSDEFSFSHYPIFYTKNSVKFNINYMIGDDFSLCNKAEYAHYANDDGSDSQGYFVCQDIAYKPQGKAYSLSFRYALFDTDDYNARVYAYENDVLYSFSVPALYGKGMRIYLLGKIKLFNALTIYARLGRTIYSDQDEISSGAALIEGNHKTDLKVEAIWKL